MKNIRIDDIGASAKYYAQHIKHRINFFGKELLVPRFLNVGPIRTSKLLGGWAYYDELGPDEWEDILAVFQKYSQIPIIAVTACWVDDESRLTPFPEKFPEEAGWLKKNLKKGNILIANHGLTHCVLEKQRPGFWGSNQMYWREFHQFLADAVHEEHVARSQEILENFFDIPVTIFVPPGNVWCRATYRALSKTNIKTVISNRYMSDSDEEMEGIQFIDDNGGLLNIHDRELKLYGAGWLEKRLKEIGMQMRSGS